MNSGYDPGKTPVIDPSRTGLDGTPGKGSSRQEICDADTKRLTWAKAISAPVAPPRLYGNIDMAGDDTWRGITVEQADQINCQSVSDGNGGVHWGDNSEIQFFYDIGTHVVTQMVLNLGYSGKIKVKGRKLNSGQTCYNYTAVDAKGNPMVKQDDTCPHANDQYEVGVGGLPLKNNAPWLFDPAAPDWDAKITELYDAVIASYMPDQSSSDSCGGNGGCLELPDDGGGTAIFGFRPAAVYFEFHAHTPQPTLTTPFLFYNFFVKILPYSNAPMTVKIDAEGPIAQQGLGAGGAKNCEIKLGQTWQAMLDNCVNITGDQTLDKQNFNKLVGGHTHTLDDIFFNVVGVNQNITVQKSTYDYVKDTDLPAPTDITTEWIFDVRARGLNSNEYKGGVVSTKNLDVHGTGLVFREYARLSQAELYRVANTPVALQHNLGDPKCFITATNPVRAAGCTGLEGMLLPGPLLGLVPGTGKFDPGDLDAISAAQSGSPRLYGYLVPRGGYLKPSDPITIICDDPEGVLASNLNGSDFAAAGCNGDSANANPGLPLWDGTYQRVIDVFGRSDVFNLPPAARDRRFFFQQYSLALVKYLKAFGTKQHLVTPADVAAVKLDFENVFWDISDSLQFDKIEYIERAFVDATHEPTNFEYGSDIKVANQRTTNWDRKMSRAERAMYQSMLGNSTKALGVIDNVRFTNLFGTNILPSLWENVTCATTGGPCGASTLGPWDGAGDYHGTAGLDSDGLPLLGDYPGAWGASIWHNGKSPIRITGYLTNVQAAKVSMPQFTDPYDQTSAIIQTVEALVPHLVSQPGVGIEIPVSGTRDKLVPTGNLSYVGNTSNFNVKYNYTTCKAEKLDLAVACGKTQQQFLCDNNPKKVEALYSPNIFVEKTPGDGLPVATADPGCHVDTNIGKTCTGLDDTKTCGSLACLDNLDAASATKFVCQRKDRLINYCCDGTSRPQFIPTNAITVQGIDTSDFLGDIFICKDPATNHILRSRMYDSAQSILDWLTAHPGSTQACDIVVRYSPFNNYIDKIYSRAYGVSVDISKSFGAGRIDDAVLWDPALLSQ